MTTEEMNKQSEVQSKLFRKIHDFFEDMSLSNSGHVSYSTWFADETLHKGQSAMMFLEAATLRLLACDRVVMDVCRYKLNTYEGHTEVYVAATLDKIENVPSPYKTVPFPQDMELCQMLAEYIQAEAQRIVEKFTVKTVS